MAIDGSGDRRPAGLPVEDTAGGVVVREESGGILVVLIREDPAGACALPAGRIGRGERPEEAARRGVREDAGLDGLDLLGPLGVRERLDPGRRAWQRTRYFLFLDPGAARSAPPRAEAARGAGACVWVPLDALPPTVRPEQRALLLAERDRIRAAVTRRLVQRQFDRQAAAYARSASHARDRDLDLLVEHLRLRPTDRALDVATGTGFTALALARAAGRVVGLDLTVGMLREARRRGTGIAWVAGDAAALPFADAAFDAVAVRRAPHHFPDLPGAVREMLRVLRPGGRLGVVDQVPPEDEEGRALMERLERLRDASHVEAYTASRWRRLLRGLGVTLAFSEVVERRLTFDEWLELAGAEADRRGAVLEALAHATPRARALIGDDGREPRSFLKRWAVFVGTKG